MFDYLPNTSPILGVIEPLRNTLWEMVLTLDEYTDSYPVLENILVRAALPDPHNNAIYSAQDLLTGATASV